MSQHRLSIPFVGGYTRVYEDEEFKAAMKKSWYFLYGTVLLTGEVITRYTGITLHNTAQLIDNAAYDVDAAHDKVLDYADRSPETRLQARRRLKTKSQGGK